MTQFAAVFAKFLSILGIAFLSFWASIPAGLALGLGPLLVPLTAVLGYAAGVFLVVLLGEPLRVRLMARFGGKATSNPNNPLRRAWDRFGLIGLSLLAPVTTGAHIGAIIGLSLGVPPRRLVVGMACGAAVWAVLITLIVSLSLTALHQP